MALSSIIHRSITRKLVLFGFIGLSYVALESTTGFPNVLGLRRRMLASPNAAPPVVLAAEPCSTKPLKTMEAIPSAPALESVLPSLRKVFVAISAHYNVERLAYLEHTLKAIDEWPTDVDVCIGSSNWPALETVINTAWRPLGLKVNIRPCKLPQLDDPMLLNWRTKDNLAEALRQDYTAFAFLEDDLALTWDALVRWAEDTELLRPHKFIRGFVRVELSDVDGKPHAADYMHGGFRRVEVQGADGQPRHFVQAVDATYCGMFVATREQLEQYKSSPLWNYNTRIGLKREMVSWGIQKMNPPPGWSSSALLPYKDSTRGVDQLAYIYHRPNNYVVKGGALGGTSMEWLDNKFAELVERRLDHVEGKK